MWYKHLFQEDFRGKPGCVFVWMGERGVVRECLWGQGRSSTDAEKTKEIWKVKYTVCISESGKWHWEQQEVISSKAAIQRTVLERYLCIKEIVVQF